MKKNVFNVKNNLYLSHIHDKIEWKTMSAVTGLTQQCIIRIAKMDQKQIIKTLKLQTYLILKDKLGIDLINNN